MLPLNKVVFISRVGWKKKNAIGCSQTKVNVVGIVMPIFQ